MNKIIVFLTSLFLLSCSVKTVPPVAIPLSPAQTESALKYLNRVQVGIDNTITSNTKIDSKVKDQLINIRDQKDSIDNALTQAEIINNKVISNKTITETDSVNLINEIKKVKVRNLFLENQNTEFDKLVKEQSDILKVIQLGADDTELKLRSKEQETNQLREQNTFFIKNINEKNIESENLKKALSKEKEISASAKVYKNWVLFISIGTISFIILRSLLSKYLSFYGK